MAAINPPSWMQGGTYPARSDRLVTTSLMSYPGFLVDESTPMRIRQGVKPSYQNYQLKVRAAATPNMTVIVSAGFCWIDQHDTGGIGTYVCVNDADVTLTIQPAGGAGQFRKDAVVASVYDAEYAGGVSEWRLEVIQGAYAASAGAAVRPALPNNAQLLAEVAVAPSQTSVTSANITDFRQFAVAAGGIIPVPNNPAPPRLAPGQMLYITDLDLFRYGKSDGSVGEVHRAPGAWTAWTPSWSTTSGAALPSLGNATVDCRYTKIGRTVLVTMKITFGTTTNFGASPSGSDNWTFTLPPGLPMAVAGAPLGKAGLEYGSTVRAVSGFAEGWASDASKILINVDSNRVDGAATAGGIVDSITPFTWVSGYKLAIVGQYETTS